MHAGDITESLKYYHELLAQLRAGKEPEAEPIPVGTAQIYGAVESLEMKEGGCVVRGWFVDTQGAVPAAVVLRVNGRWEKLRVGKASVSTCRSRWSTYHKKKK